MASRTAWPHGVTDREHEVLVLVADHLTNAEIADRLTLSVRTVESHVTSLIRRLEVPDRRSLARRAEALGLLRGPAHWPRPGGDFVGREAEAAVLAAALAEHRVVTVAGPGGVGKTTLTTRVVEQAAADRPHGGWFVDLAQVGDGRGVVPAVAAAVGVVEAPGGSLFEALLGVLSRTDGLLLLDNCEHMLAEVERLVSAVVTACPRLTVVATSRARLGATYEWVYELPALNGADAVRLFGRRAAAAGGPAPEDAGVEELCARLEGMALAIELAAARYPSLGLDGLSTALADPLRLLGDGGTARQRSLRATITWSVDLLGDEERAVLAACSVFASPFTVAAAQRVVGPDLSGAAVALALGGLADQHLLRAEVGTPTTYRFLEVVRQFAAGLLGPDAADAARRHAAWTVDELGRLRTGVRDAAWCAAFDRLAVELRVALSRPTAPGGLGESFADELVQRGRLEEAQARYEQAAGEAAGAERVRLLRLAAGAAAARLVGDEAIRLLVEARDAATSVRDDAAAADALAWAAIHAVLAPGIMAHPPTRGTTEGRLTEARDRAPAGSAAAATVEVADAALLLGGRPGRIDVGRAAAAQAAAAGAPVAASSALDAVCAAHLERRELPAAMGAVEERGRLLAPLPVDATTAYAFNDFLLMGCEVSLATGELRRAAAYADRLAALPCYRDYVHPPLARRLEVDVLAGNLTTAAAHGERFLASWEAAGRHRASTLAVGAYALALGHGLRGDDAARAVWVEVAGELLVGRGWAVDAVELGWSPALDAVLLLDRDDPAAALARLSVGLGDPLWSQWAPALWRPWYAAALAEAVVLTGTRDPGPRLRAAAEAARDNPVTASLVRRATALASGDCEAVAASATELEALGSAYQAARSRRLSGLD